MLEKRLRRVAYVGSQFPEFELFRLSKDVLHQKTTHPASGEGARHEEMIDIPIRL